MTNRKAAAWFAAFAFSVWVTTAFVAHRMMAYRASVVKDANPATPNLTNYSRLTLRKLPPPRLKHSKITAKKPTGVSTDVTTAKTRVNVPTVKTTTIELNCDITTPLGCAE